MTNAHSARSCIAPRDRCQRSRPAGYVIEPWSRLSACLSGYIPERWPTAASPARTTGSSEVVRKIPSAQLARLQSDEQVVACSLGVPLTLLGAEVTRGYPADDRLVFQHAQARRRAKLEAAVRRAIFTNDDARPWISTEVPRFPVTRPGHDVEAVIAPLVPDWRKENRAVAPVRREDGEDWQL